MTRGRWVLGGVLVLALVAGAGYGVRKYQAGQVVQAQCAEVKRIETDFGAMRSSDYERGSGPVIAFLGDSYAQGLHLADPLDAYPYETARDMKARPLVNGVGGAGFVAQGPCGNGAFPGRVSALADATPAEIVVQGGINDRALDPHQVEVAARTTIARLATGHPTARIVLLGPFSPPGAAGSDLNRTSTALRAAATAEHVPFIDPRSWSFPTLSDRVHPTADGARVIGDRLAAALEAGA